MRRVRKTSVTTSRRRVRRTRRKKTTSVLLFDVVGIVLIFLCPITLIALAKQDSCGVLGRYVAATLEVTVGIGAYVIPFFLALLGAIFIAGPLKIIPRSLGIGSSLIFLVIVTWASLTARIEGAANAVGGGYLGNGLAAALQKISGNVVSYILLIVAAIIGVVVLVDTPLAVVIDRIRNAWLDWKDAARERAEMVGKGRKSRGDKKPQPEVIDESRRRTLARIFGRGEEAEGRAKKPQPVVNGEPPVRTSPPLVLRSESATPSKAATVTLNTTTSTEQGEFVLPPTTLLNEPQPPPPRVESELRENIEIIERTLEEFKVVANVVEIAVGPTVARYEIQLAPGIKVNKIVGLADNLAMSLAAIDVRVEAPIPGKAAIGVEVPNKHRALVGLREVVESKAFQEATSKLTFALGKDVAGKPRVADLAKMPHLLIGGATNAGKSVGLNTLIASLLFRATPDELKFILIDPKRVELSLFDGIPHLACPVVKDVKQAASILRAAVQEMEHRYMLLSRIGARNIDGYNQRVTKEERMPYMVIVVDELCDLMMQCAAEVEGSITRLAQLARATGIHLVIATQRPSVDVITGVIKANISSRIAFAVSSHHDSRTILDQNGAERLIGSGDLLFLPIDASKPVRIQGCYMSEAEIAALCKFLKDQRSPEYTIEPSQVGSGGAGGAEGENDGSADEFYEPSVRFVVNTGYCSTSMLQRKFKIGYTRAARIVDTMEQQGIVGPLDGAKPRQVMISKADLEGIFGGKLGLSPDKMREEEFDEEPPPYELIGDNREPEDEEK
jgi:S-DNA-T family DNA segregation ATPase FtsK/SpoIIIE